LTSLLVCPSLNIVNIMNTSKPTSRRHRKRSPLTAEKLIRKMQKHPTLTAIVLGLVFAALAAYVAVGMAT
jgi:hypothetical protein